jgi:hypothetical protein
MSTFKNFTCTKPADRERAERAILKARADASRLAMRGLSSWSGDQAREIVESTHSHPTFIWCGSPQTAIVMAKVLSDLHEGTHPIRLSGFKSDWKPPSTPNYASQITWPGVAGLLPGLGRTVRSRGIRAGIMWESNTENAFQRIVGQIQALLIMNPNTDLNNFSHGGEPKGLVETAFNNTQPHISEIKLNPDYFSKRLDIKGTYLCQHNPLPSSELEKELAASCGWVWDYGDFVFMCERPSAFHLETNREVVARVHDSVMMGTNYRLHNTEGPAVEWPDGFKIYSIRGVTVPEFVVEKPKLITIFKINQERNAEVRRIMIDRYKFGQPVSGLAAYIIDSGARRLDHDEQWGTLWGFHQTGIGRVWDGQENDVRMLEVVNRSPEPDGSFKHYFLRVPPQCLNSKQAAAWTFGLDPSTYDPLVET